MAHPSWHLRGGRVAYVVPARVDRLRSAEIIGRAIIERGDKMTRWFRVYADLIDDPKFIKLGPDLRSALFTTWCIAAANNGRLVSLQDMAIKFRLSEGRTRKLLDELSHCGFIDGDETGTYPHNWNGRQYKFKNEELGERCGTYFYFIGSDDLTEVKIGISKNPWARISEFQTGCPHKLKVLATFRFNGEWRSEIDIHDLLKSHRGNGEWFDLPKELLDTVIRNSEEKLSYEELVVLLRSNATNDRSSNYYGTTTEQIQSRADSEQKEPSLRSDDWPSDYRERFWQAYPRRIGKSAAMRKLEVVRRSKEVSFAQLLSSIGKIDTRDPKFIPHPTTWLNQGRYLDGEASIPIDEAEFARLKTEYDAKIARGA